MLITPEQSLLKAKFRNYSFFLMCYAVMIIIRYTRSRTKAHNGFGYIILYSGSEEPEIRNTLSVIMEKSTFSIKVKSRDRWRVNFRISHLRVWRRQFSGIWILTEVLTASIIRSINLNMSKAVNTCETSLNSYQST